MNKKMIWIGAIVGTRRVDERSFESCASAELVGHAEGVRMKVLWWSLGLCAIAGCVYQATPTVATTKVRPVTPPIQARVLLLIAPSFEGFVSEEKSTLHKVRTHYGQAATNALSDLFTRSFAAVETRRLADADVQSLLAGNADTSTTDLLLVPFIDDARVQSRQSFVYLSREDEKKKVNGTPVYDEMAEVRLRVNARSLRTGNTFTWRISGVTGFDYGWGVASGVALESALHALGDSLGSHRAELERVTPTQ